MRSIHLSILAMWLVSVSVYSEAMENRLGVNVGATSIYNEDSINLDQFSGGVTYKLNEVNTPVKPRLDFDYVRITDYKNVSSFLKGSVNGVYDFNLNEMISPYALLGIGYEVVNDELLSELDSRAFAQGGMGVTYHPNDKFDLNVEGKVLQALGSPNQDNEVIVTMGVDIPVGTLFNHGVVDDECPVKIEGADEDRDGVPDAVDQCPNTPCYFTVDDLGCPIKATLRIYFDYDKATIRPESLPLIEKFAKFLIENKGSMVKIIGHTDSDGSEDYNMVLSLKRAQAVVRKLIEYGVSPNRLSAEGKGESMPIATNNTEAGKALNRRIEAELTYPEEE